MRILVVGDGHSWIHERPIYEAMRAQGHDAVLFSWHQYFQRPSSRWGSLDPRALAARAQNRALVGPAIRRINRDLLATAVQTDAELIFVYRGTHILPETLARLRRSSARIFGYNNDDPFSAYHQRENRHFLRGLPLYDHLFAYREKNLRDYATLGHHRISLLRDSYIHAVNHPVDDVRTSPFRCDVLFAGHYESDDRDELLLRVLRSGADLRVVGPEWERAPNRASLAPVLGPAPRGPAYNLALNSAAIALVFLSKINHDTYTRRCFEIPAAGTFMLSEYSDDMASLFTEGVEAEYFRSGQELVEKVRHYVAHPAEREGIAAAGRARLLRDGHEVNDRVRQIVNTYNTGQHSSVHTPDHV